MRVVTTASRQGLQEYAYRWLDGRKHWPAGTEFFWYVENCDPPADDLHARDILDLKRFVEWRSRHIGYAAPDYRFDVVKFAHKVFAACDAFEDFDGVGVWLDADCVTYRDIPEGLIEQQVAEHFLACYQRAGTYTETGLWIMNCAHPAKKDFLDFWRELYYSDRFSTLSGWTDCHTLDATIRAFGDRITVNNLSGQWSKYSHPQAVTELGSYIDHCKGPRKVAGYSPENAARKGVVQDPHYNALCV